MRAIYLLLIMSILGSIDQSKALATPYSIDSHFETIKPSPLYYPIPTFSDQSKWKSYIGMGVGYLPFGYDDFIPMHGFYDERFIFNEVINSAFVNLVYKNRFMLENRLTIFHYFGHYHSYYNAFYNQTYLGFNIMTLALKDPRHGFYIKFGLGVTNNCACGPDVPFRKSGLMIFSYQLDYYLPITEVFNLHISAGNNFIRPDNSRTVFNFTEWQVGLALRLM